jgi:hypothetical protein
MDRHDERDNETGFDSLGDATGMDAPDAVSPMEPADDSDRPDAEEGAGGDERTAIEGAAGLGATHRGFGATPADIEGGAGTNVPPEDDEESGARAPEDRDSTDPRGY